MELAYNHCTSLASPSFLNFAVSIVILLGILLSYLTQHYRIISRRSSEGISPYFVLLGTTSGTCALSNILVLPASRADIACCKEISGFACFAGLLGIFQVGLQWTCFAIILLLFLLFFPSGIAGASASRSAITPSFRTALIVGGVCVFHGFVTAILNAVLISRHPNMLQSYANILGLLGTVLASIQYLPQLYTTWRLKAVGSLSIPMMCIQTPGSFLWAGSLAARVGWEGWSTWFVYVVTGMLQGGVLGMGIFYELRNRKIEKSGVISPVSGESNDENGSADVGIERERPATDETTPLLRI